MRIRPAFQEERESSTFCNQASSTLGARTKRCELGEGSHCFLRIRRERIIVRYLYLIVQVEVQHRKQYVRDDLGIFNVQNRSIIQESAR